MYYRQALILLLVYRILVVRCQLVVVEQRNDKPWGSVELTLCRF